MDNPLVRTADSIFTDRVNLWSRLKALEESLYESRVPRALVSEFLEGSVRMELCFAELRNFDRKGEFLGKHPFIAQKSERDRILALLRSNPTLFSEEMYRIRLNISRYQSHLNSPKFADRRQQEQQNLEKFKATLKMYEEVLSTVIGA